MKRALLLVLVAGLGLACSAPVKREPVTPVLVDEDEPEADQNWSIDRADYEETLKGGLQKVMRWYFLKPHYRGNEFTGYMVEQIIREELANGPIRVGDVIIRINGGPVERPEHAMAIWRGLWNRKNLTLKLLRRGKIIVYDIPITTAKP